MAKAVKIAVDGIVTLEDPKSLEDYQKLVDGNIEYVYVNPILGLYVNDEGLYTKDRNVLASLMLEVNLYGSVLLIGPSDEDGNTLDLENAEVLVESYHQHLQ